MPSKPHYHAWGASTQLFECRDAECLYEGPAGTGKTRCVLEYACWCGDSYPGARILLCRKTRKSMTQSILVTWESKVLDGTGFNLSSRGRDTRSDYRFPNGSEYVVAGIDNPDRIMSAEYDLICVFEARELTEHDWEMLLSRNRNLDRHPAMPYQQIIADTNPDRPSHWLNIRAAAGKMTRIKGVFSDNPAMTDQYLNVLNRLTGVRKKRLLEGQWAAAEGIVYDEWDPNTHLINRMPMDINRRGLTYIASKDWGWTNPGITQIWALDSDLRMYRVKEIYRRKKPMDWWLRKDKELNERYHPIKWVCDPSEPELILRYKRSGMCAVKGINDVLPGINRIKERLKVAADGKPRLYLCRDASVFRDSDLVEEHLPWSMEMEFENYIWETTPEDRNHSERPIKQYDHALDAGRYVVMEVDKRGGQKGMYIRRHDSDDEKVPMYTDEDVSELKNEKVWAS